MSKPLSLLAQLWFVITAGVVLVDALFVLLRPMTLTTTDQPWSTWQTYTIYDKRYSAMDDPFVVLQSYLNLVEITLQLSAVAMSLAGAYSTAHKTALIVSVMTFYKTVMYFMMEHFENSKYTKHNNATDLLLMVQLPSFMWLLVPAIVAFQSYGKLSVASATTAGGKKVKSG